MKLMIMITSMKAVRTLWKANHRNDIQQFSISLQQQIKTIKPQLEYVIGLMRLLKLSEEDFKASLIIHPPLSAVGFTLKLCKGSENRCTNVHTKVRATVLISCRYMASWCIPHALEERHQSPEAQSERCREEGGQGRLQGGPWIQSGPAVDTHRGLGIQRTILSLTRERFHVNFTVLIPFLLILSKAGKQYSSIRS